LIDVFCKSGMQNEHGSSIDCKQTVPIKIESQVMVIGTCWLGISSGLLNLELENA